jgi:hypothetical protein
MLREKMTIKEAAQEWVRSFNAIPQSLIEKAYPNLFEDGLEILVTEKECSYCGGTDFTENEDGEEICSSCERLSEDNTQEQYGLPMWGTMWTFDESLDDDWVRGNLEIMRECGFWVYESDELGILFGINGAGYDFYKSHWIPLYKARGLQWHDSSITA